MKKNNNRKGFTIVELVIVIAVIAILAAVLIPTFSGIIGKANDSATLQEARNRYTTYTAEHDYTEGSPKQDLAIEVGDKYVVVKGGQMQDEIYDELDDAKTAAGAGVYVYCEEHNYSDKGDATPSGNCADCQEACDHGDTAVGSKCGKCGVAVS